MLLVTAHFDGNEGLACGRVPPLSLRGEANQAIPLGRRLGLLLAFRNAIRRSLASGSRGHYEASPFPSISRGPLSVDTSTYLAIRLSPSHSGLVSIR